MANVLNRTTRQYLTSVNTPEYPVIDWIIGPNLAAVNGFASKYWIITGDVVTLMSPAQRAAVDAAELSSARDGIAGELDILEDVLRAFTLILLDELNNHATQITAILNASDNATTLANFKSAVALIPDVPQRTIAQLKTALRGKLGT